jgi:hypothetical protein
VQHLFASCAMPDMNKIEYAEMMKSIQVTFLKVAGGQPCIKIALIT